MQILEAPRSRRLSLICFYLWMRRYCRDGETSPGQWKQAIGPFGDERGIVLRTWCCCLTDNRLKYIVGVFTVRRTRSEGMAAGDSRPCVTKRLVPKPKAKLLSFFSKRLEWGWLALICLKLWAQKQCQREMSGGGSVIHAAFRLRPLFLQRLGACCDFSVWLGQSWSGFTPVDAKST